MTTKFVIWSYEHSAWWSPARQGYTSHLDQAGRYDQDEAGQIVTDSVLVEEVALLEIIAQDWGPPLYHPYKG